MIIRTEKSKKVIFTQIEDGFKREDARLTQLIAKLSRKFKGKIDSFYDPDATYNKSQQKIMVIESDIAKDAVSIIRLCGIVLNIESANKDFEHQYE